MKYFYIILGGVAAYVFIEAVIFYYKLSNLPKLQAFSRIEETVGTGPTLRYIAAGDSTAVGYGATKVENTYTDKIALEFSKTNTVTYKNVGVVGAKTSDVLEKQLQQIVDFKPDIVTISIGGNDATHLVSGKQILENEREILSRIISETNATVYITNVPNFTWAKVLPWFYRTLIEYRNSKVNKEILEFETDRIKIVDIHDFGWDRFPDIGVTNAPDKFHPNDLGYQNWTDAFLDRISSR